MSPKENQEAQRKQAWKTTKAAVSDYARNPCRATEIKVKAALDEVKRVCAPCRPKTKDAGNSGPDGRTE